MNRANYSFSSFLYLYPFFIQHTFSSITARSTLLSMLLFSIYYETVYRGIVPYAFKLAWGKTKGGLLAGALVSALIFSGMNFLLPEAAFNTGVLWVGRLSAFLMAIWLAALVLRWGSIWPGVMLYTLINLVPSLIPDFFDRLNVPDPMAAYVRLCLFELPLVIFGVWLLMHTPLSPQFETKEPVGEVDGGETVPPEFRIL